MSKKILFITSILFGSSALLAGCGLFNFPQEGAEYMQENSLEYGQSESMSETATDLPTLEDDLNELELEPESFE